MSFGPRSNASTVCVAEVVMAFLKPLTVGRVLPITSMLFLALGAAPVGAKPPISRICKDHNHTGRAASYNKASAADEAGWRWRNRVIQHDGASWAISSKNGGANIISPFCEVISKNPTEWRCTVRRRPCRWAPTTLPLTKPMPPLTDGLPWFKKVPKKRRTAPHIRTVPQRRLDR